MMWFPLIVWPRIVLKLPMSHYHWDAFFRLVAEMFNTTAFANWVMQAISILIKVMLFHTLAI